MTYNLRAYYSGLETKNMNITKRKHFKIKDNDSNILNKYF